MALLATCILFFSCALLVASNPTKFKCRKCSGDDCEIIPECQYGMYQDRCGYFNCYKGPAEYCEKNPNENKVCREGLKCQCHQCNGCIFPTGNCFQAGERCSEPTYNSYLF